MGVCETPTEYDTTPAMLEDVLNRLALAGIEILPMREAVAVALGESRAVDSLSARSRLRAGAA